MADLIRTYVKSFEDEIAARERRGFVPAQRYFTMAPEKSEIGCIVRQTGTPHMDRGTLVQPIEVVERIFALEY